MSAPRNSPAEQLLEQARRGVKRARRIAKDPAAALARARTRVGAGGSASAGSRDTSPDVRRPRPAPRPVVRLAPTDALRENGFTVFRGAFSPTECARLAADFKDEAGIEDGVKYTKVDATNKLVRTREVLFDRRVLDAVRSAVGPDVRFLQVSDLHYRHDTFGWHRDSVHRAQDSSQAPDWADPTTPFGVVKAILYLESENAAMGIMPGSHASPFDMDHTHVGEVEKAGGQTVIGAQDEPNRRFADDEQHTPLAWRAEVGDLLVFDERLYHAGRRVEGGVVSMNREAPKFTLSLVFGLDNAHSERMYSYFRFARRELAYRDLPDDFTRQLTAEGLVMSHGWTNFYERQPDDLRHVYLRDPAQLDVLLADFSQAGAGRA